MTEPAKPFPFFEVGDVVATPGAMTLLTPEHMSVTLHRHMSGDWGLVDAEDKAANDLALLDDGRLLSVYEIPEKPGKKFYIITEADRSATTFLLPEEY